MLGSMRDTTCPACRHAVPAGRWCNRCGAALREVAVAPPSPRRRRGVVAAVLVALTVGAGALAVALDGGPTAPLARGGLDDTAVVLAEDPPAPPLRASPTPGPTPDAVPGERVDVICSDLRIRSVPVVTVSTDDPGALVELANGTCVVMDPNGVVVP